MSSAEMDIASDPSQLAVVREFVTSFCREKTALALDETSIHQLELAVNEAATNIMRHAHRGRSEERIQVEADVEGDQVVIQFHYGGAGFDPETAPPPAFDGSREGGFGVYLIAHCVDQVRYSQDEEGRNCICLVKHRSE
jgi:serine/threonine-protein kinase RsbW